MEGDKIPDPPKKGGAKKGQFFGKRGKKRFARHLRHGKDFKDSSTRRRYNAAIAAGAVPPTRSLAPPCHSSAAARKPLISELQQSLRSKEEENVALQADLESSTRQCSRLEDKASNLVKTVVAARRDIREARKETQQLLQEKRKVEEQLDEQEELLEAEISTAVAAAKAKEKVRPLAN